MSVTRLRNASGAAWAERYQKPVQKKPNGVQVQDEGADDGAMDSHSDWLSFAAVNDLFPGTALRTSPQPPISQFAFSRIGS